MKILVVCMKYDYGIPERGLSYEYINFYQVLKDLGHEVSLFDFMTETHTIGKNGMQQKLLERIKADRPNLTFFTLYTDQFDAAMVQQLKQYTKTLCFFHDDTWRVEFTRFWADKFDFFTTPDVYGEYKYKKLGLEKAIYFPFGCNKNIFQNLNIEKKRDVSFVGAWHPFRNWLVNNLRKAGFSVEPYGFGWPNGPLPYEEMVKLFNESKINLNMSNSTSWDIRYLKSSPKALINTLRSPKNIEQIKARHFEINSCGAFQLSYYIEGLERHYTIGNEIGIYVDSFDLIEKVRFYLDNENLREDIAKKGYERSMSQHCFESRFNYVFSRMELV
ncbi:MAG: hypothetical protein EPN84_04635 [Legionella sp.]|nr:MAG: hypothetical protein EPN84_04635 [Legionella sp.]